MGVNGAAPNRNEIQEALTMASKTNPNNSIEKLTAKTSNAKNKPPKGLLKSAVIPAAPPAINKYRVNCSFCKNSFAVDDPIAAPDTTVDTSMPVDPPMATVKKPPT